MHTSSIERDPDFEDEKIRLWQEPREGTVPPDLRHETVLPVNLDEEEIYEARVYPLQPHPSTIASVLAQAIRSASPPEDVGDAIQGISAALSETTLKMLSKRNRENGRITYLVMMVGPSLRALLDRGEAAGDADYRLVVAELEDRLLASGLVGQPFVTEPEEWKQYEQQLPEI